MKTKPLLTKKNIEHLSYRFVQWIYEKISTKESEKFLRETNICWNVQFGDNIVLNRESVNEIFFYINDKFGFDPPIMKYDYIDTQSPGPVSKERIFDFRYGNSMEEFAKFVNFLNTDFTVKFAKDEKKVTYQHINCLVQEVQYIDVFIICKLKSTVDFTDNKTFIYNSFFTNIQNGEIIQILEEDFKMLLINGREILYNIHEISEYETSLINRFLPNTNGNNHEDFKNLQFNQCSNCGEEISASDDYCQICGFEIVAENSDQLVEIDNKDSTICQITYKEILNNFLFTTLRIETTPDFMKNDERELGWFTEQLNTYYVFKNSLHDLKVGQQIYLNLKDFELFQTINHISVYFNRKEFTNDEILDLKTYNIH